MSSLGAFQAHPLVAGLQSRILILDGAMGTMIQTCHLSEAEFRGKRLSSHAHDLTGNYDILSLTRPAVVADIHRAYLAAGADIIETNTFSSSSLGQARYKLEHLVYELNVAAACLAREAADEWSTRTPGRPRFVAGAMGPTDRRVSLRPLAKDHGYGTVTFEDMRASYKEQVRGLMDGGVDAILPETAFDALNLNACLVAIEETFEEKNRRLPLMISMTISDMSGCTVSGQTLDAFFTSIERARPLTVGINCALGAAEILPCIAELSRRASEAYVTCCPSAGLPDASGGYDETPAFTSARLRECAEAGLVNVLGGCCGTTPDHIAAIARAVSELAPRKPPGVRY